MKLKCPHCTSNLNDLTHSSDTQKRPTSGPIAFRSYYYRKSDRRWLRRYACKGCDRSFSQSTTHPERRQHKRQLNLKVRDLLCSGVSQRDAARILKTNPKTVVRKFRFMAQQARIALDTAANSRISSLTRIYFDEMETFEHTKCKPLSIPIAVSGDNRNILALEVAQMPARGKLAAISRKKYGPRKDMRTQTLAVFMKKLSAYANQELELISDRNPSYASIVKQHFPRARHIQYKGRKPSETGQGELRKHGFDPLFEINHTCAMIRAHVNRLIRKTWCTTKKPERLLDHLHLYAHYHNQALT